MQTQEYKERCVNKTPREMGEQFLTNTVSCDRTWICHSEPESKRKSTGGMEAFKFINEEIKGAGNSWQNYTLFWATDSSFSNFPLHGTRGTSVTCGSPWHVFENNINPSIFKKCRGKKISYSA
jgi:hypothetical protein